jgi:hypothetical protein
MNVILLVCFTAVACCRAADPSGGWLSYAKYTAPHPTDIITRMKATMIVPPTPESANGSPAFWFGLQSEKGNAALVQPIMSKWLGDSFYMFQEIFDWTDFQDKQSSPIKVEAGDVVVAQVEYIKDSNSYKMTMNSTGTTQSSTYTYQLLQQTTESTAYFVLEHQPDKCNELPKSGNVGWNDIEIDVNYTPVKHPLFVAAQENPACGSKAIVENGWVNITWKGE